MNRSEGFSKAVKLLNFVCFLLVFFLFYFLKTIITDTLRPTDDCEYIVWSSAKSNNDSLLVTITLVFGVGQRGF